MEEVGKGVVVVVEEKQASCLEGVVETPATAAAIHQAAILV